MSSKIPLVLCLVANLGLKAQGTNVVKINQSTTTFNNSFDVTFVKVPAGQFEMGSPDGKGEAQERPKHPVRLAAAFFMSAHEVTQAQWKRVTGTNPSKFKADNRPVDFVSWEDVQGFVKKINEQEQGNVEYRLPTEAEWEYACRAGSTSEYCFGDNPATLQDYAWFDANSDGTTQSIKTRKPNAWGLYDMHGNAWEWCQDVWHDNYAGAPQDGKAWESGGNASKRVVRGGSWAFAAEDARSSFRMGIEASSRLGDSLGFRLVAVPKP